MFWTIFTILIPSIFLLIGYFMGRYDERKIRRLIGKPSAGD